MSPWVPVSLSDLTAPRRLSCLHLVARGAGKRYKQAKLSFHLAKQKDRGANSQKGRIQHELDAAMNGYRQICALLIRRGCSRTPSLNRARAPRAPPRQSADWNFCQPFFFPPLIDSWSLSRSRALSLPVRVPGKKLTDRRRWPAVTQHEVLILTRDIMSLQRYQPKSA